ncbi:SDR family oxidoreductase [Prevotella sp. Rep29]|uniref:SDR family NAD(P)-dependent oxidoreductase n=1 Tax=Prevotella sp. Rep29 TaxID=2691580 RepID=UPI001C6DFE83|nr:SDR family NAD(P)-dependent oxidoreductase [Prevotella sp. Rep29]QYR10265.1 SDR family NAD(P)-dependent oxidoreductase [Prevotella sp. Rep29]
MKRAIVIGASSGIGFEMSRLLIGKGWTVAVAARRSERLEPLRLLAPERVIPIALDVNQDTAPEQLHELITHMEGVELYIHVAGIGRQNRLLDADIENRTAATNVWGFTRMVGEVFRYMAEHGGGHIAVISSIAGTKGLGPAPAYSATKAFQATYIQSLEQLANSRKLPINFTDIRPGFADTELLSGDNNYPMMMTAEYVARKAVRAIERRKHVAIIDWRYRLLTAGWRCLPNWIWRRLKL